MRKDKFIHILTTILGFVSICILAFDFIFLPKISPKLIALDVLTGLEGNLLTVVGFGLMVVFCFCFFSALHIVKYLRYAEKVKISSIMLLVGGILAMLFIFADIALLNDIVNQYEAGLAQPEWDFIYPILGSQAVIVLVLFILHLRGYFTKKQLDQITKDSNIYLVVQYIGIISGLVGLTASSMGFIFPDAWDLTVHTVTSLTILSSPYILAIFYWLVIKMREKDKQLYDEKQRLDIGRSAFLTQIIETIFMVLLFALNFNYLDGVISMIWLPLFLFSEILIFSLGNLYFSNKP